MKKGFLFYFFLAVTIQLNAQKEEKYVDCYIIQTGGDTLHAKYKKYTSLDIMLGTNYDSPAQDHIYEVKVSSFDFKSSYVVPSMIISRLFIDGVEYEKVITKDNFIDTLFLLKSKEQPMRLYSYEYIGVATNGGRTCTKYYYVKRPDGDFAYQAYKESCDVPKMPKIQYLNRTDFASLFWDYPELMGKILNKSYAREDIVFIVHEYNAHYLLIH